MYFISDLLWFRVHALYVLTVKWHCLLSPIPGHDGFDKPAGSGYYHYLHHAHFECNYGSPFMDKLFGAELRTC